MTKAVGFLRVPPLKFVEQIVCFFSFLISVLFGQFFSVYISVQFHLLQSNWVFFSHEVCKFFKGKYILILSCLPFLRKFTPKSQNCLFKLKFSI